jgi:hypothetical protein
MLISENARKFTTIISMHKWARPTLPKGSPFDATLQGGTLVTP